MTNTLIPMEDFVLIKNTFDLYQHNADHIRNYAQFLKQQPELWMFVPCDEEGRPMKEPKESDYNTGHVETDANNYMNDSNNYYFKPDVLFEGFEVEDIKGKFSTVSNGNRMIYFQEGKEWKHKTLSEITHYNLQLSQTAINKIYK